MSAAAIRDASTLKTLTGLSFVTGKTLQGELRVGRDATGRNVFWLEGLQGRRYLLTGPTGQPVTNAVDAEARAMTLMRSGAATQLRETAEWPGSNRRTADVASSTVDLPASAKPPPKVLALDLEDPAISSRGGQGRARTAGAFLAWDLNVLPGMNFPQLRHNLGQPGSALTSTEAIGRFQAQGVPVEVANATPRGSNGNARWHAVVRLNNDHSDGYRFGNATAPSGSGEVQSDAPPTYSLPKNASPEFQRGYRQARREHGAAHLQRVGQEIGQAGIVVGNARSGAGRGMPDASTQRPSSIKAKRSVNRPGIAGEEPAAPTSTPRHRLRQVTVSKSVGRQVSAGRDLERANRLLDRTALFSVSGSQFKPTPGAGSPTYSAEQVRKETAALRHQLERTSQWSATSPTPAQKAVQQVEWRQSAQATITSLDALLNNKTLPQPADWRSRVAQGVMSLRRQLGVANQSGWIKDARMLRGYLHGPLTGAIKTKEALNGAVKTGVVNAMQVGNNDSYRTPELVPIDTPDTAVVRKLPYVDWALEMSALVTKLPRFDVSLLRAIRARAPSEAEWAAVRTRFESLGIRVPSDRRLDLVLPYKPVVVERMVYDPADYDANKAGARVFRAFDAGALTSRETALIESAFPVDERHRSLGRATDAVVIREMLKRANAMPEQMFAHLYPELSPSQLAQILRRAGTAYPKTGADPILVKPNRGFDGVNFKRHADGSMEIPGAVINEATSKGGLTRQVDGITIPRIAYRGDSRPPEEILREDGLWGQSLLNGSLGTHIFTSGELPGTGGRGTSWISLTGNPYVACSFAVFTRSTGYIYEVRATYGIAKDVVAPGGAKAGFAGAVENEFNVIGVPLQQIRGYRKVQWDSASNTVTVSPLLDLRTGRPVGKLPLQ